MTFMIEPKNLSSRPVSTLNQVTILFPRIQIALLSALLVVLSAPTEWTKGLFVFLLLVWQVVLSSKLAFNYWRPHLRICSKEASMSVIVAGWYAVIAVAIDAPAGAVLMALTLITIGLYGWYCHE